MKKRLRKKKHKGEFSEFGREFLIIMKPGPEENFDLHAHFELFMWVIDIVEKYKCSCGGSLDGNKICIVIELGRRKSKPSPDEKKELFRKEFLENPEVEAVMVGEEFDIWNARWDKIPDIEFTKEQLPNEWHKI